MPSPDVSAYVDLTLFSRSVQDIFDELQAAVQIAFPDWIPLEGHIEVVLLEAVAKEVWQLEQAANNVAPATFEGLIRLLQIVRDPGTGPSVPIQFHAADTAGYSIPAGTRLQYTSTDGLVVLDLTTDTNIVIAPGSSTATVTTTAAQALATVNGATTGAVVMVDALSFIDSVTLNGTISGGRDPEDSAGYLNRGSNQLTRLTTTLVRADQFATAAEDDPDVVRAYAVDDYNIDAGSGAPGDHPGHISVLVGGDSGVPLSSTIKSTIQASLEEQAVAPLNVHVGDSTITTVNVTASLKRLPSAADADVVAAAQAALTEFLNPDVWPYGRVVYRNDLISLLDQVAGVDVPLTLTAPSADVTPTGVAGLVQAGTLTITTTT